MKPQQKYILGAVGFFGYVAYIRLAMYLGKYTVSTSNYEENNKQSFFIDMLLNPPLSKKPLLSYRISKMRLLVDGTPVAETKKILSNAEAFKQEFVPIPTANFTTIYEKKQRKSQVEICYKTFLGLRIKRKYNVDQTFTNLNNSNTTGKPTDINSCSCQAV